MSGRLKPASWLLGPADLLNPSPNLLRIHPALPYSQPQNYSYSALHQNLKPFIWKMIFISQENRVRWKIAIRPPSSFRDVCPELCIHGKRKSCLHFSEIDRNLEVIKMAPAFQRQQQVERIRNPVQEDSGSNWGGGSVRDTLFMIPVLGRQRHMNPLLTM